MKTFSAKANEVQRRWWVIDAQDQVLGQVAVKAATLVRGKEKAIFTPHVDTGDFVIVINAEKVVLTGNKANVKSYFHHTGMIAGERWTTFQQFMEGESTYPLMAAIWGMLPHSSLGHEMIKKLKIYAGATHPHASQKPEAVTLKI